MRFFLSYGAHPILVEAPLASPPFYDFVGGAGKIPIDVEKALDVAPPFCDGLRSALRSLGNRASFKFVFRWTDRSRPPAETRS
jgi:hypothetical protein